MTDFVRFLAGFELLALTVGFWAFTLLFHVLADWRSTAMGRHFMAFMACCDLVLTWSWTVFVISPPVPVRLWVAAILYGALTFVVWRQVRILIKMQIMARNNLPPNRVMADSNGQESEET